MNKEDIFKKLHTVGRASLTVDLQNSHSGNMAVKGTGDDGEEFMAITATGSQKGELTPDKVCYPSLNETNFGYFKSSSETDIHARVLQLPGALASMHCHTKVATVVTMDSDPAPKQNPRAPLVPVDPLGVRYLGSVPVEWVSVASGSKDMIESVERGLKEAPAVMIQAHGTFARGKSLEEAFFYLALTEHSGEVIFNAGLIGLDLADALREAKESKAALLERMPDYSSDKDGRCDFADEPDTVELFTGVGYRAFESRLSPFHTGSMSVRGASTMLYCPKFSLPLGLAGPLLEVPLDGDEGDPEMMLHSAVYAETPFKSLIHSYVTEAEVLSLEADDGRGRIIPIDAEGGFLYPSIPIIPAGTGPEELSRALMDYKVCQVRWGGSWAAGEQSLGEALRHTSSLKDISRYRVLALSRGLGLANMEPVRSRSW